MTSDTFRRRMLETVYPAAIAFVALTGSFNTLHKALRFSARGRQ